MDISYQLPERLGIVMNWDSKYHTQQRNSTSSPSTQGHSVNGMPYQLRAIQLEPFKSNQVIWSNTKI